MKTLMIKTLTNAPRLALLGGTALFISAIANFVIAEDCGDDADRCVVQTAAASPAGQQDPSTAQYDYNIVDMPIGGFLKMLAADSGLQLALTERVKGNLRDVQFSGSVDDILQSLSRTNDLEWFKFNGIIHVSSADEAVTRLIALKDIPIEHAKAALLDSGLVSDRRDVVSAADGTAISLSGPPKYVGIAEAIVEVMPKTAEPEVVRSAIRVRRGVETNVEYYGKPGLLDAATRGNASTNTPAAEPEDIDGTADEPEQSDENETPTGDEASNG